MKLLKTLFLSVAPAAVLVIVATGFMPADDRIVFLSFAMKKDEAGKIAVSLANKIEAQGKIKETPAQAKVNPPYLLLVLTAGKEPVDSILVDHPLYKRLEYHEPGNGLSSQEVKLDKADFFIRFQKKEADKARLVEVIADRENQDLITVPLN